jgi:hypothetical protein
MLRTVPARDISARSGAAGKLVAALGALHATIDATEANAKAEAELHNEDRCLALRVLATADVRGVILRRIPLRQLGTGRRVCKDWHRWNSEGIRRRVPPILM